MITRALLALLVALALESHLVAGAGPSAPSLALLRKTIETRPRGRPLESVGRDAPGLKHQPDPSPHSVPGPDFTSSPARTRSMETPRMPTSARSRRDTIGAVGNRIRSTAVT